MIPVSAAEKGFSVADAVIVLSENASITDSYAASRLKYYLDEITGDDIEIVSGETQKEYLSAFKAYAECLP